MNPVERADTPGRSVREEFAMQQHDPTDEVEPEEHGHRQGHVYGHLVAFVVLAVVLPLLVDIVEFVVDGDPAELHIAGDRVDGADDKLQQKLQGSPPRDGDTPVLHAVVYGK